jgi:hypothetical protein
MVTLSKSLRIASVAVAIAMFAGITAASAGTSAQPQPRGAEVSHRLAKHSHRISHEVRKGKIAHAGIRNFHMRNRMVRKDGHIMASKHGGKITKTEGRSSNQQKNGTSLETGK